MSEDIKLFETQKRVYPRLVSGRYRSLKWLAMTVLLGIYYVTPFLRWDRGEGLPDQAILIDMGARRAYILGIEIWPQEVYYLAGVLVLAAVGLFFVTTMFGRVWCGYACPQTVWTDLFVAVERWIQGDRNARIKLDAAPWSIKKIAKKLSTHVVWLIIGMLTGGAWVLYFNDAPTLINGILAGHVSSGVLTWIVGLTLSTYIMAGYSREQVCTYMCPYARFQSGMFDRDTLIIGYDVERGEPRGTHKSGDSWDGRGHCIDCSLCVQVCPTGIDIRNGLQLACIACGLCVDACNSVMDKVGLPRGLIRYDTETNMIARGMARSAGKEFVDHLRLIRPRTFYYTAILCAVGGLMLYSLLSRSDYSVNVLHDRNPLFVMLSSGEVRNSYTVKILNKAPQDRFFALSLHDMPQGKLVVIGGADVSPDHLKAASDTVTTYRVTVTAPAAEVERYANRKVTFDLRVLDDAASGKPPQSETTTFITRN